MKKTHGMSKTKIYLVWQAMIKRCHNQKDKSFPRYGGKGISVCDRWRKSFDEPWTTVKKIVAAGRDPFVRMRPDRRLYEK